MDELSAFIGLHIIAGGYKAQFQSTDDLWSNRDGHPVFRAAMSQTRFKQIKSALRFDDTLRRNREDPLAPIRDVFNQINANLGRNIKPSENLLMNK